MFSLFDLIVVALSLGSSSPFELLVEQPLDTNPALNQVSLTATIHLRNTNNTNANSTQLNLYLNKTNTIEHLTSHNNPNTTTTIPINTTQCNTTQLIAQLTEIASGRTMTTATAQILDWATPIGSTARNLDLSADLEPSAGVVSIWVSFSRGDERQTTRADSVTKYSFFVGGVEADRERWRFVGDWNVPLDSPPADQDKSQGFFIHNIRLFSQKESRLFIVAANEGFLSNNHSSCQLVDFVGLSSSFSLVVAVVVLVALGCGVLVSLVVGASFYLNPPMANRERTVDSRPARMLDFFLLSHWGQSIIFISFLSILTLPQPIRSLGTRLHPALGVSGSLRFFIPEQSSTTEITATSRRMESHVIYGHRPCLYLADILLLLGFLSGIVCFLMFVHRRFYNRFRRGREVSNRHAQRALQKVLVGAVRVSYPGVTFFTLLTWVEASTTIEHAVACLLFIFFSLSLPIVSFTLYAVNHKRLESLDATYDPHKKCESRFFDGKNTWLQEYSIFSWASLDSNSLYVFQPFLGDRRVVVSWYALVAVVRDFLLASFLGLLMDFPKTQCVLVLSVFLASLLLVSAINPYKKGQDWNRFVEMFSHTMASVCCLITLSTTEATSNTISATLLLLHGTFAIVLCFLMLSPTVTWLRQLRNSRNLVFEQPPSPKIEFQPAARPKIAHEPSFHFSDQNLSPELRKELERARSDISIKPQKVNFDVFAPKEGDATAQSNPVPKRRTASSRDLASAAPVAPMSDQLANRTENLSREVRFPSRRRSMLADELETGSDSSDWEKESNNSLTEDPKGTLCEESVNFIANRQNSIDRKKAKRRASFQKRTNLVADENNNNNNDKQPSITTTTIANSRTPSPHVSLLGEKSPSSRSLAPSGWDLEQQQQQQQGGVTNSDSSLIPTEPEPTFRSLDEEREEGL